MTNFEYKLEETQEQIDIMSAFVAGERIQYLLYGTDDWVNAPKPCWNWYQFDFRVKPTKSE